MNGAELFTYAALVLGVIACAVQYGIAIGQDRSERRIERQRGAEVKTLLEFIRLQWWAK